MCNRCYQLKGQDQTGLDWIWFTIGYLSCHCSKDCPMAPFSLTRPCASRSVVVLSKENPLQGYQWCETLNSNLIEKHCQRHNGPEGWVHLAKVTSWGLINVKAKTWELLFQKLSYQLNRYVVKPALADDEFDGLCQQAASSLLNGS